MANQKKSPGKNGSRKLYRSVEKCAAYKNRKQREKNKVRKITKHLKTHVNDLASGVSLERVKAFVAGK